MTLYDRYEPLELRRDDGIQTFHAREIETARPVQLHLFAQDESLEDIALLSRLDYLPDAERRRVIERGEYQGRTYLITDRLAGYQGFREWLTVRTDLSLRNSSLDGQFLELFDVPGIRPADTAPTKPSGRAVSELDKQFFELFDTPGIEPGETASPNATGAIARELRSSRMFPAAAKSLAGILLGILAAILVLGLLVAVVAFRPW